MDEQIFWIVLAVIGCIAVYFLTRMFLKQEEGRNYREELRFARLAGRQPEMANPNSEPDFFQKLMDKGLEKVMEKAISGMDTKKEP